MDLILFLSIAITVTTIIHFAIAIILIIGIIITLNLDVNLNSRPMEFHHFISLNFYKNFLNFYFNLFSPNPIFFLYLYCFNLN